MESNFLFTSVMFYISRLSGSYFYGLVIQSGGLQREKVKFKVDVFYQLLLRTHKPAQCGVDLLATFR